MDTMLLRHAHDNGAKVLQGVKVQKVLFEDGRAVGVRAQVTDGWERDLYAKLIVDASGRRCFMATQLGMKQKDPSFNQFVHLLLVRGREAAPEALRRVHALLLPRAEPGLGLAHPAPQRQRVDGRRAGQGGLPEVRDGPRGVLLLAS